jgi:outer membrane cobalamin receptor
MSPPKWIALAVGCACAPALAQQKVDSMSEVVVTASKIEKPVNEMTHSVTVVSEQQIKEQGFTDITEILRQQTGLEFKQVGGPGQFNYLKLRGLGSENVLVVVDDVIINTASGGNTRNLFSQLSPDMIESMEIVRGPQATLYGANSTAGVIVIRTKSGRHADASLGLEAGSMEWRKLLGSLRDGVEVGGGDLQYALNLSQTESDNIHQYEYFEDASGQLKLEYVADRWSVGGSFWKSENDFGYAELDEASCCQTERSYWSFQTPDPNQHSETGQTIGSAHFDWKFTDNLKQTVRVGRTQTDYSIEDRNDGLLGYQTAPAAIPAGATGTGVLAAAAGTQVPIYDTTSDVAAFYEDQRTQAEYELVFGGSRFNLMGGLGYQKQQAEQRGTYGVVDNEDSYTSAYSNGDIKLMDNRFIVSLGVRLDDYESWGRQTTGNAGFSWQLAEPLNVYVNYGTSFKPATMSQLFNPTTGDSTLSPETGRTAELGFRSTWLADRLNVEASYWNTRLDDVIFFDYSVANPRRPTGFGQYNNGAEGKTSGVEFKTAFQLSTSIGLYANYTHTDASNRAVGADWVRTVQIASHKGNVGLNFRTERLTFGTNAYYSGPRLRWAGDMETDGYLRLDISGRFQVSKGLAMSLRVENLLDDDYLEELGYAETGRYAIFGAEYKFF